MICLACCALAPSRVGAKELPKALIKQLAELYDINRVRDWSSGKLDDTKTDYFAVMSEKKTGK
jgi:hypothetical protein